MTTLFSIERSRIAGRLAAALLCATAVLPMAGQATATKQSVQPATPITTPPPPKMPQVNGTEVDRVVAIVNGDLILDSDVDEETRFQAFQPYREAGTFTRERSLERLINRNLILQQAKLQGSEEQVSDEAVNREINELRHNIPACIRYGCASDAGWHRFLADNGFTEAAFRERWRSRMQVLQFIEDRFREGSHITDAEVKTYYEVHLVPQYKAQGVKAPPLDSVSAGIRQVLLEQQISHLLVDWLKSLRAQGQVVVLHPGETAP